MKTLSLHLGVCHEISPRFKNAERHSSSVKVRTFLVRPPPFSWNRIFRCFDAIIFMISACFSGLFGRLFFYVIEVTQLFAIKRLCLHVFQNPLRLLFEIHIMNHSYLRLHYRYFKMSSAILTQ